MRLARTARRKIRVKGSMLEVAEALKRSPTPEEQERLGISDYRRVSPVEWTFRQTGQDVRVVLVRDLADVLVFELARGGSVQRQAFRLSESWRGGTDAVLTMDVPEPAPLPRLKGYMDRTLRALKERVEAPKNA